MQQASFKCNSHFATQNIKKTYSQVLTFYKIKSIFCFIRDILKRNGVVFFSFSIASMWWWKVWWRLILLGASVLIYANTLTPLVLHHDCECLHMKKENYALVLFWQVVGFHGPCENVSGTPTAHVPLLKCLPVTGDSPPWYIKRMWRAFKKYTCSDPKPDQWNQNHWEWGRGISIFFKASKICLLSAKLRNLSLVSVVFEPVFKSMSLFPCFIILGFPKFWCATNTYLLRF